MAPLLLHSRRPELTEEMDRPDCDPERLRRTYRQFAILNRLISRWDHLYRSEVRPLLASRPENMGPARLLDIGFGGGDIPARLARLARGDGFRLKVTAVDSDPRAVDYAAERHAGSGVRYRLASPAQLLEKGEAGDYDLVTSNHLMHHLAPGELGELLGQARRLSCGPVLFCDIERSDWAWLLFGLLSRPFFHRSFITRDGLRSIRRSYTRRELRAAAPPGWEVRALPLFRLLLVHRGEP
ncbi:MAG: methyltransferase domain-containing protein [Balneolaceae bacterium]|nr:methyltransferase domain-containing protein [Balneolaceae bacterium]